jgi:hypothetical protein
MTTPPLKSPKLVSAKESTPSFVVAAPHGASGPVFVVPDAKSVKALRDGGDRTMSTCYALDQRDAEWSSTTDSTATIYRRNEDRFGGVHAVHSERLVEKDGAFALEVVDAFVDPATRGARTIAKTKIPLALVAKAMGGVRVFAARDERKTGPASVTFVVTAPTGVEVGNALVSSRPDGSSSGHASCGHLRVALEAPARAGGDSATVNVPTELPPLKSTDTAKEKRVRDLSVFLSVSKTSRDKEPVVAVSFGWDGRERSVPTSQVDEGD